MQLDRITIDNFRSYKNESTFEDLANINIVIGPNNSGKSNLLKALVWYRDMHYQKSEYNVDFRHSDNRQNSLILIIEFSLSKSERERIIKLAGKNDDAIQTIISSSPSSAKLRHLIKINALGLEEESIYLMGYSGDWLPIL